MILVTKKYVLLNVVLFYSLNIFALTPSFRVSKTELKQIKKKQILIFSSKGGGGHASVSGALDKYLNKNYDIKIINIFEEILNSLDPIKSISGGRIDGEGFYNFCLRERMLSFINVFTYVGAWGIRMKQQAINELLAAFCIRFNPDLIISVVPLINEGLLNAAQRLRIPFIVVTNDLDTTQYINNIKNPDYRHFYYTLAFNDIDIKEKIVSAGIKESQIKYIGFPLRPEFFIKKNKNDLKKEFNIPKNKFVTMILAGGNGSLTSCRYVRILTSLDVPLHIIACIGNNLKLKQALEEIKLPKHVTLTIMGYTTRISDLMILSDLLLTKPGPNSIFEAIAARLPIVIDQMSGILWWEQLNVDFVCKYGLGDVVQHFKQVKPLVSKIIKLSKYRRKIQQNMLPFNQHNFEHNINNLVNSALELRKLDKYT